MIATGTALLAGAALAGGAAIYSSNKAASAQTQAASQAAQVTSESSDKAIDAQMQQFYQNREDLAPWRETGTEALNYLNKLVKEGAPEFTAPGETDYSKALKAMGMGPGEFKASPGYDFRLNEGVKALDRSASAKGTLRSGAQTKQIQRFGQDYASGEYDNFLNQWFQKAGFLSSADIDELNKYYTTANFLQNQYYNKLKPYQSLAGVGQSAAEQTAAMGSQAGTNVANIRMNEGAGISNALLNAGNARASGYTNMANAVTGAVDSGISNYLLLKYLNK